MSDTRLLSLSEIFTKRIFRIPDIQRGYSWGEKQLEDFWDDLLKLGKNHFHYIGLLTVSPIERAEVENSEKWQDDLWLIERGYSAFQVIDGQQRLTTMIILINEILKTFDGRKLINYCRKEEWIDRFLYLTYSKDYRSYIFGYDNDNPSEEYFKTRILGQHSSRADKFPETLYTANMEFAKNYFAKKIKDLDRYHLEALFEKVISKYKFNYYEVDKSLDIHVTFETMNNRGKELSKLELLKNRLVYITSFLKVDTSTKHRLRKDIIETWKTIYEYLGKNKKNHLDDDDFLANHWIMYFPYNRREAQAYAQFLLNETFTAKNVVNGKGSFEEIKKYIDSMALSVKDWFYIHYPQDSPYSADVREWLEKMHRVGMGSFKPMIMAVLSKQPEDEELTIFLRRCEEFCFLVFKVSHRTSNTESSLLYRRANIFYIGNEFTLGDLTEFIKGETFGDKGNPGWLDLDRFKSHIKDLFLKDGQEGFYSWNGLKYLLYEYERELQGKSEIKVTWEEFNNRQREESIEHIFPQTPTDEYWQKHFGHMTEKEQKVYQNSLGNLLLLSRSKNAALQNFDFDTKKCKKDKSGKEKGYFNGSYSEIQVANKEEWTPEEIRNRGIELLEFMEERWGINFSDWGISYDEILFPIKTNKE